MKDTIAVIFSAWKRKHLQDQIDHILSQSIKPDTFFCYQNKKHVNVTRLCKKHGIELVYSDHNFHCFGRFTVPLLINTEYCLILDDDILPGTHWIENCLRASKQHNAIIGGAGRIIVNADEYKQLDIGDNYRPDEDKPVDYIIHSYFFRTDWIKYMWRIRPYVFEKGEDIHFSAACKIYGGIDAIVAKQPENEPRFHYTTDPSLCCDQFASWRMPDHKSVRSQIFDFWVNKGWQLINS